MRSAWIFLVFLAFWLGLPLLVIPLKAETPAPHLEPPPLESSVASPAGPQVELTDSERAFLAQHPTIVLGADPSFEPLVIRLADGSVNGLVMDILKRINALTGAHFQLTLDDWHRMVAAAKTREIDGLSTSAVHAERADHLAFSTPYISVRKLVLVPRGNPQQIATLADLSGLRLAVHASNLHDHKIAESLAGVDIQLFETLEETLRAVIEGRADATIENGSVLFNSQRLGLPYLEIAFTLPDWLHVVFSVRNDWPEALSILNKGLAAIPEHELMALQRKWLITLSDDRGLREPSVALTVAERAFLAKHPKIVLGTDPNWEPYVIRLPDGSVTGFDNDILTRINALTGANFQLKLDDWHRMVAAAKVREIDGLSTSAVHAERADHLAFSNPYISVRKLILVQRNNPHRIESFEDLSGRRLAVHASNLHDRKIAESVPGADIRLFETVEETLRAVVEGSADATIENGAVLFNSQRLGLPYLDIAFALPNWLHVVFSVRNDWPEALSILNKGLAAIPEHERATLQRKWFGTLTDGRSLVERPVALTAAERAYLQTKGQIALCVDPDWRPYEYLDADGRYVGVIADLHYTLASLLDIELRIVKTPTWTQTLEAAQAGRCDLISALVPTPSRQHYLRFTRPFLHLPLVVATRNDQDVIANIGQFADRPFGVVRSHASVELIGTRYPQLELSEVKNVYDGLRALRQGQLFGFIETVPAIGYEIRKHDWLDVRIAGYLEETLALAIGVNPQDPMLLNIYEKALANLSDLRIDEILTRWSTVQEVSTHNWRIIGQMAAGGALVLALLLYHLLVQRRHNNHLSTLNDQLQQLSTRDHLTGAFNRRWFSSLSEKALARARRQRSPLAIIIADIDHFKTINDRFGHDTGDTVLVEFVRRLEERIRTDDCLVRWGGEEFLILCQDTDLTGALELAERLRQAIAETPLHSQTGTITASFGVAEYRPEQDSEASLMQRADAALYAAKAAGRNRVQGEHVDG